MEVHNRGKFHLYSICGCEVKKFEMFSWRWSIHEMAHFGGILGRNSPKCRRILLKFAPQLFLMEIKTLLQEFFKNSNFSWNRTFPKFARFFRFILTLRPFFSMKEAEIEKSKYLFRDKTTPSGYPNIAKSRLYLVPIFQEKYDYFLSHFDRFLVKKGAWSPFKGPESKSHLAYAGATIPGIQNMQRVWSHHMPVLSLSVTKVVFF